MKKIFSGKRLAALGVIALLLGVIAWRACSAKTTGNAAPETADGIPGPAQLCRLARSGLRRAGCPLKPATVTLKERFPDGSCRVDVMLENGRTVSGRFYRDRQRLRIAIDDASLHSREIIIHER